MGQQRASQTKVPEANRRTSASYPRQSPSSTYDSGHSLLQFHSMIGNRAMGRLLQAKLKVNEPGNEYEREADAVAEMVMRMAEPVVQRACSCGNHAHAGGECEECRKKRETELLRVEAGSASMNHAPAIVQDVLRSPGQSLDSATRAFMEPRLGFDFSRVRVHTDAKAAESARAVNAKAYTVGQNVVFGTGQYAPTSREGRNLLAHELAHTIQQSNGLAEKPLASSSHILSTRQEEQGVTDRNTIGKIVKKSPFGKPAGLQRRAGGPPAGQPATAQSTATPAGAQPPAARVPNRSIIAGMRVGSFGHFDAELDRNAALDAGRSSRNEPCRLTLTIRAQFNFKDTQTPNRWQPNEKSRWQNEFIRAVSNRWSFRFLLMPSQPCPNEPCKLATAILRVEPITSSPHHVINVFYEKPSGARSGVGATSSTLYRPDVNREGRDLRRSQTVASHEAGHMLGLPHVHCNTNNDECYGTNREESADVMGRGEIVTEQDYVPFVQAMNQITGCTWQVREGRRGPLFGNTSTLLGITLGAVGAIAGGIRGAVLGGPVGAVLGGVLGAAFGGLIGYGVGSIFD